MLTDTWVVMCILLNVNRYTVVMCILFNVNRYMDSNVYTFQC